MTYLPIEEYGVIGNMRTVALVSTTGSIDFFCPRKFDDASIFLAILDDDKGGRFSITPDNDAAHKQHYWPDTNILVTRFLSEDGVLEVTDFMPVGVSEAKMNQRWLIRRVKMVRGSFPVHITVAPAFNYARDEHTVREHHNGLCFDSDTYSFALSTDVKFDINEKNQAHAIITPAEGDVLTFTLGHIENGGDPTAPLSEDEANILFDDTVHYWRNWLKQCTYKGRWREAVYRSALAMKLLTYEPTGAIVASPTFGLPEDLGGERNWDYRYSWLRDSTFTLYGFLRIGFTEEAGAFIHWLQNRIREPHENYPLQIMYTIDGDHDIPEIHLDHLEGYRQSTPVRIGNGAAKQLQLDIYGELMDSIYLYNKYGERISHDLWQQLTTMLNWVADNWELKDKGIWEIRNVDQAFVYSKLMCWVALDRGLRLADKRSFPAPRQKWLTARDALYEEIMTHGWNEEIGSFTQYYHGETLDASNLLMPLVFFLSPHDPRLESMLKAVMRTPDEGGLVIDGLVYRYNTENGVDGLSGDEGTFNMCTFWLVEALTRNAQLDEARLMFERMLGYANHVGLYAEETGTRGEALGNFPQAFTHLSLISAAYNLDRTLNTGKQP